jgi:1-acyl-sn-glycerol-3-phosphate acyltransferase
MNDISPQVYRDDRPAERFQHVHDRVRSHDPSAVVYNVVRSLVTPPAILTFRTRAIGLHNVPASGPVVLAPNHFSQWDHFVAGVYLRRKIQFMAKSQMFSNRVLTWIFKHGGTFPILRGRGDETAMVTARSILERGGLLLMYPEGGRSRTPGELAERVEHGIGRLVLETGAPVVPVAIHGSDRLRRWRRDWIRLRFPRVTVQYGEPMRFDAVERPTREQAQEVADRIFERIRSMYEALSAALESHPRREVLRRARDGVLPAALLEAGRPALPAPGDPDAS